VEDDMMHHLTMDTPAGPFTVVVNDQDAVRASGFTAEVDELLALIHSDLRGDSEPVDDVGGAGDAVRSYFDGDLTALDSVLIEQRTAGPFMAHSWEVMREIKPGEPVTYSQFAELAGRPAAVRGAAAACARNAAALFAPCHRVLRSDGSLGGYRWGLTVKRFLLDHESK
jgi:methylated-DNA-[protein]-cysteine S-methyltransferase